MAHPLTVKINSAIYSLDTPIFPHWYWFMGAQIMSRMFTYVVRGGNKHIKTRDWRSLSFGPNSFPPVTLMARLTLLVQRVCSCYDMWCRVLKAASHVPRVLHSLCFLFPSIQVAALTEDIKTSGIKWKEAMWNLPESVHLVFPNSGLYQHNPSHVVLKVHASFVHI